MDSTGLLDTWLTRLRARTSRNQWLLKTAQSLPVIACFVYVTRWLRWPIWLGLAAALASAAVWWLLTSRRSKRSDAIREAASLVDRRADLHDLVKTGVELERRGAEPDQPHAGDHALRAAMHRLVQDRAAATVADLDQASIEPLHLPRYWLPALALCAVAVLAPVPSLRASAADRSVVLLDSGADPTNTEEEESSPLAATSTQREQQSDEPLVEPEPLRLQRLDARLAALLQADSAEVDAEALAELLAASQNEGLSADALARLEELAEQLGADTSELAIGDQDGENDFEASHSAFEELQRESAGEQQAAADALGRPEEGSHARGDSATPGEQRAAGEQQAEGSDSRQDGDVQSIELPPTGDAQLRRAEAGETDMQLRGEGLQIAGDQAGQQEGQQRPGAGGGDSSGPQSGESQLYGEQEGELETVTLELTLLKANEETEREKRPQRRWRASRQEDTEVSVERLPEGDWSRPDDEPERHLVERHHRQTLREYFTPESQKQDRP